MSKFLTFAEVHPLLSNRLKDKQQSGNKKGGGRPKIHNKPDDKRPRDKGGKGK